MKRRQLINRIHKFDFQFCYHFAYYHNVCKEITAINICRFFAIYHNLLNRLFLESRVLDIFLRHFAFYARGTPYNLCRA